MLLGDGFPYRVLHVGYFSAHLCWQLIDGVGCLPLRAFEYKDSLLRLLEWMWVESTDRSLLGFETGWGFYLIWHVVELQTSVHFLLILKYFKIKYVRWRRWWQEAREYRLQIGVGARLPSNEVRPPKTRWEGTQLADAPEVATIIVWHRRSAATRPNNLGLAEYSNLMCGSFYINLHV